MTDANDSPPAGREPYEAPELEELGTLADLTQGESGANQDSNDVGSR